MLSGHKNSVAPGFFWGFEGITWSPIIELAYRWRKRHAYGAENSGACASGLRSQQEALGAVSHFHFGQRIQVEEDVRPLKGVALGFQPVLESLTYYQSQERAEHMSSDGPVILVKHRPRTEKALGGPEELLYHP